MPHTGTGDLTFRQLRPGDYDAVLRYFDGLSPQTREVFHPHPFDEENARRICQPSGAYRLGAFRGDDLVGYAWFDQPDEHGMAGVGIGVIDAWQGRGVGEALMRRIIDEARRRNLSGLWLTVYKTNHRARRLYEKVGFVNQGEWKNGREYLMHLDLRWAWRDGREGSGR